MSVAPRDFIRGVTYALPAIGSWGEAKREVLGMGLQYSHALDET